jgi:hypothetical protein
MRKDNREFVVRVQGRFIYASISPEDFDIVIKDLVASGYNLDDIEVFAKVNFSMIPERYEVDD